MPAISFDANDINRGKIVEPGNYVLEIGDLTEATSKNGDSTNWVFENSKIIQNADNGSVDFAGVPMAIRFNSKAKGFMIGFLAALSGEDVQPGARYELKQAEGKKIIAKIVNEAYEGRIINKIDHVYRHFAG
jgi:hypothetical protein